jgi:tetratricopeptide (TPR) repeat protein
MRTSRTMRSVAAALGVASVTAVSSLAAPAAARADDLQSGIALYQQGKYAEAEGLFRNAAGNEAKAYLAASLAKQGKYVDAEAPAKAVLADSPTQEMAVAALGDSLVGQKKYDEAVTRMGAAIGAKASLAHAYYWRGQAYYKKSQPDKMVADFETFLRLAPRAPEAATVQQLLAGLR